MRILRLRPFSLPTSSASATPSSSLTSSAFRHRQQQQQHRYRRSGIHLQSSCLSPAVASSSASSPLVRMPPVNSLALRHSPAAVTNESELLETNSGELLIRALLKLPQVCIRNPVNVSQKLESMINGGKTTLQIISDFDYTLSKITGSNGERLSTTHGVFDDNAKRIDPELGKKFEDLRAKFYPIEFSPHLSISEKIPFMEEWWYTSHEYILQSRFTKQQVRQFVDASRKQNRIQLRDGVPAFLLALDRHQVPLVLFSAGIGNVIEIYLDMELRKVPKNIHLISNMMRFDQQGVVASFSEPLIHTFCKNSSVIRDEHDFFHHIANRTHVLLLGDSLGDSHMDVGVERNETTVKIGFYNGNTQDTSLLEQYLEGYDIVLLQDDTMTVPQMILNEIVKEENSN